jgi:hypothetical protein
MHGRVATGTSQSSDHTPATQLCFPSPHVFEQTLDAGGTSHVPQSPISQISLPTPQGLLQARSMPSTGHGSPIGNAVRAPQRSSNAIARIAVTAKAATRDLCSDMRNLLGHPRVHYASGLLASRQR